MRISAGTSDSSALGSIAYILSSRSLTDPISVLILDSTTTGGVATTPPPEPSLTWSPGSHYGWLTNLYPESNPYLL